MNEKKAKLLRRRADEIVLSWVKEQLLPEEAEKINIHNLYDHLPEEAYFFARGQRRLNIMSPRWVYKHLKRGTYAQA